MMGLASMNAYSVQNQYFDGIKNANGNLPEFSYDGQESAQEIVKAQNDKVDEDTSKESISALAAEISGLGRAINTYV